jgi:hypothetical protein
MHARHRKTLNSLAIATLGSALLLASTGHSEMVPGVPAQFRGCDSAGWCKFWIQPDNALEDPVHRVRPLGIPEMRGGDAVSIDVRDRLNALMSSFVHQHKRIVLYGLRRLGDGTWTAGITVNESPLEDDPALHELLARRGEGVR